MDPRVNGLDLNIFSWNGRSIRNKETELKLHVYTKKLYDVIALQETWLKPKNKIHFESYETIREDRLGRNGGGVMFLIKEGVQYWEKPLQKFQDGHLQTLAITVKTNEGDIDILNVYNPVTFLVKTEFRHYLSQMGPKYVILGDMNAHHNLWEPSKNGGSNHSGRMVYDIIMEDINRITLATPPDLHTQTQELVKNLQ